MSERKRVKTGRDASAQKTNLKEVNRPLFFFDRLSLSLSLSLSLYVCMYLGPIRDDESRVKCHQHESHDPEWHWKNSRGVTESP